MRNIFLAAIALGLSQVAAAQVGDFAISGAKVFVGDRLGRQ